MLYLIVLVAWPASGLETFAAFATYVLGAWIALRLLRIGLRKLTWRLRNRLMVAYVFIAVLPILLVLTLVGLGAYMLAGQMAVYVVRSELDRRLVSLQSVNEELSAAPAAIRRFDESQQQRFPGPVFWTTQNGTTRQWPPDANVSWPAAWPQCEWYCIAQRDVTTPGRISSQAISGLLGVGAAHPPFSEAGLAPGLGDFFFVQREIVTSDSSSAGKVRGGHHQSWRRRGEAQFRLAPLWGDTAHGRFLHR